MLLENASGGRYEIPYMRRSRSKTGMAGSIVENINFGSRPGRVLSAKLMIERSGPLDIGKYAFRA